ncbi:MAG: type toxin-antitoxin system PemK/MazF family toxin [Clostridia bacterium]|jgi:mRNA interferase MazF|nr:type toxin-antitoxin system PemK/MazF family toxin [Clostridia bacterium]
MVDYQWGIFWADLNPSRGSEQAGQRPVLVVSAEEVNQALPIVTILSITSVKPGRKVYPTEVFLHSDDTGLSKESIVMSHQIRAISKDRLREKCGSINDESIKDQIRNAMRIYLDL